MQKARHALEVSRAYARKRLSSLDFVEGLAQLTTGYRSDTERELQELGYYDYSVLKAPVWRWEIILYFFFGGLTSGCYVIATLASWFGSRDDQVVTRTGYYLSLLMLLPCPLLLIKDLGRPERFLHMLRIFKVKSPMSMGVWALLGFSFFNGLTASIQAAQDNILGNWWGSRLLAALPQKLLALPGAATGAFIGGYSGVLLTATSVPLWSRSKLLGSIFIASAISTSTALISLVLHLIGIPKFTLRKLEELEWSSMLVEMAGLLAFLRGGGRAAHPLVGTGAKEQGMTFWWFVFGGGMVLPWLLQTYSLITHQSSKGAKGYGLFTSVLVLMGGYFLRSTIIKAGRTSSMDSRTTLWNAKR